MGKRLKKLLVILGPTTTGKTDLGIRLAKKFNGEIISADSRQVYKGLDIGTGKVTGTRIQVLERKSGYWVVDGVKIWMFDVADPKYRYDVKQFLEGAVKIIEEIYSRGKLPIVAGGSGLYIKGILEGFSSLEILVDPKVRRPLIKYSKFGLQEKLKEIAPSVFEGLNNSEKNNPRRLIRHIELVLGKRKKGYRGYHKYYGDERDVLKIGLFTKREILNKRIDESLKRRVGEGMVEEAERLHQGGLSFERMNELGLEYGMIAKLLRREIPKKEFLEKLKIKIRQFAKRQMTWFKKVEEVNWFEVTDKTYIYNVERAVESWYNDGENAKLKTQSSK